jgi:hypothetical protein
MHLMRLPSSSLSRSGIALQQATSFYVEGLTIISSQPETDTYHNTFFSRCALDFSYVHFEQRASPGK